VERQELTAMTIDDIAREAGVSVSTVSRILNNKPDVAKATRERVQALIAQKGYAPHTSARNLAAGKSRTIALLFPAAHTGFSQLELDFFIGAASSASGHDFFFNLMTDPVTESELLGLYRRGGVGGVILMQICMDDWRVNLLKEHGLPFVMIGRNRNTEGLHYVDFDFETAIQKAFGYLHDLGHREIGFITRPKEMREQGLGPAVRSLESYQNMLKQLGLHSCYRETHLTVNDVYEATLELLLENPTVTAIVTVNGATSAGIYQALQERGKRVPKDVSVVAVATNKMAQLVTPALTNIHFPSERLGFEAASMLIEQFRNPATPKQTLLAPELVTRDSSGKAPRQKRNPGSTFP
jgi:DNA-binding LacI/PurR family transcriptional regulator